MKDIKLYIRSYKFHISIFILVVALFLGAWDKMEWFFLNLKYTRGSVPADVNVNALKNIVDSFTGYDVFMNGIGLGNSGYYSMLSTLSIGFLFSRTYCQELNSGSSISIITRKSYSFYYIRKIVSTFFGTFVYICISCLLFLFICLTFFTSSPPMEGYATTVSSSFSSLYYNHPFIFCVLHIINQAVFLSLLSVLGMGLVFFTTSSIIISISPLIIYLGSTIGSQLLFKITGFSWFVFIFPDLMFKPFLNESLTGLNHILEIFLSYLILFAFTVSVQVSLFNKHQKNYIK